MGPAYWYKSSYSGANADCVEFAERRRGVLVRDTKNRGLGHLAFGNREWTAFLRSLRSGRFQS